jgi:quinoprotein glucose dehydrogenase
MGGVVGFLLFATMLHAQAAVEWPAYGGDVFGSRYSPLTGITRENVKSLGVAWTYHTGEKAPPGHKVSLEATPIMVAGTLYFPTPMGVVIALDAETGREKWKHDMHMRAGLHFGDYASRGVAYWVDPAAAAGAVCMRRIIFASVDARLTALDAATGRSCPGFGKDGEVDLRSGLRNAPFETEEYEETSPPAVVNGMIVVGSAIADNNRIAAVSGEVRGFDARTGALRWTWDPVPQDPKDAGYATWQGPNAHQTGAANTWSVIAGDPERDLVFLPTGSASVDYFGGERKGENRYSNSIVALRASTGKLVWHFQTVHHDLWDYDNASPPALVTIRKDGRNIPVVIQANKNGMVYVLDRETGVPVFPVEERPVPKSDVPGEEAWPTQPFTTFFPPLVPHTAGPGDAFGPDDANRSWCRDRMAGLRHDGIFTPPSERGTLVVPSNIGGAHWGGVTYDPKNELIIVPVNRLATLIQLIPRAAWSDTLRRANPRTEFTNMRGTPYVLRREILLSPAGVPCTPPPHGELVALSTKTGAVAWRVALGAFGGVNGGAARPGSPNLGGAIVTAGGVAFIGATLDRRLRAIDAATGAELWSGELPAGGKATPMTYRTASGRQMVVIAAGGDNEVFGAGDAIVAFEVRKR